ncbi:ribosome biogenesis protein SLX9-domain-containing protein [Bisporella sp. PMI_857]|nr:ribosome biogenesis protein SLX9-domain-containing protein [Bisporella sp. PMI_857]
MAPTAPKKRTTIRTKASKAGSGLLPHPHREGAVIADGFSNTKKDKRTIKHSAFISRIEKSHKKPLKRRRPNKKLVTNLESLGDVIGELESGMGERTGEGKFTVKSLKTRPGALKRKEKLERMEAERFGKNMAQLVAAKPVQKSDAGEGQQKSSTSSRWAALQGFIAQTMVQKEEFKKT